MEGEGKRIYVAMRNTDEKNFLVGVFSNRKILFETISQIGLEGCFIEGARKRKDVTPETIATGFCGRGLTISRLNDEDQVVPAYKVLEIKMNEINPFFKRKVMSNNE